MNPVYPSNPMKVRYNGGAIIFGGESDSRGHTEYYHHVGSYWQPKGNWSKLAYLRYMGVVNFK